VKKSVFVEEITAAFITESLPKLAESFRAEGATAATATATAMAAAAATTHDAAITTARLEASTAERARILGIQSNALPGHRELVAKLVADPSVSAADAATQILAAERVARGTRLGALQDDEKDLIPPAPGPTPENDVNKAAKEAVALAVKFGVVK